MSMQTSAKSIVKGCPASWPAGKYGMRRLDPLTFCYDTVSQDRACLDVMDRASSLNVAPEKDASHGNVRAQRFCTVNARCDMASPLTMMPLPHASLEPRFGEGRVLPEVTAREFCGLAK